VSPNWAFFITSVTETSAGYTRTVKSILGQLPISRGQSEALGLSTGKLISPYLELCCLRISANVSYANAAADVTLLTGMSISANTQQRLVQSYAFPQAQAEAPIAEAGVDGGKVRLRTPIGEPSTWRDYKVVDTEPGMVAMLGNNLGLIDWLKAQPLAPVLTCLGDGHDGVWNIIEQFAQNPNVEKFLTGSSQRESAQGGRVAQASTPSRSPPLERTSR